MPRHAHPWFRRSDGWWYIKLGGKLQKLARGRKNRQAAIDRWHELMLEVASNPAVGNGEQTVASVIGTELTCVGWLRKNMAGNWQCLTKSPCPESGRLVIVRAAEADGQKSNAAVFEAVGQLKAGKAIIDAVPGPALAEGRPVYFANPPTR